MLTDSSASSLLSRCADEYLERLRRGERPTVAEYVQRFPHLAERLREYLPLVSMLEEVGSDSPQPSHSGSSRRAVHGPVPERLGDYRLLREIGRGGMGIIFEAEQLPLGRRVALKLLMAPRALDETGRARFQREARVASRLHHTNIVPVYEVGQAEGWWFYSMQFITGRPLDAVLHEIRRRRAISDSPLTSETEASSSASRATSRDASPTTSGERQGVSPPTEYTSEFASCRGADVLPLAEQVFSDPLLDSLVVRLLGGADYFKQVAELLVQAADALTFAHQQGVVHRDIKPANLLIDANGLLWVADFGLARATELDELDELTRTGDFVGTMKYMAPEQFRGRSDERSDLFSLGLVLYEALTLRAAFETSARWRLLRADSDSSPAPLRSLDPSIPRDLATICEKCLEADSSRRYGSASELAEELRRFLRGEAIFARPIPWWSRLGRWCRRNPVIASLSSALLLAMVIGTSVAVWQAARYRAVAKSAQEGWNNADANATRALMLADAERTAREDLDRNLYVAHMNLVQEAAESGNAGQGLRLLEQHRPRDGQPDRRSFEWHYWHRVLHRDEGSFEPFGAPLRACALSPSSRLLAISGEASGAETSDASSAVVQLCDTNTRQTLRRWPARTSNIKSLSFLGDDLLIGGSARGEVIVWSVSDGAELRRWSAHRTGIATLRSIAESNSLVTTSIDGAVACWNLAEVLPAPKPRWTWTGSVYVHALDVSPDGQLLAGACFDRKVRLWELSSGRVLRELDGHSREVFAVTFAPSANVERPTDWTLLSGGGDRTLRAWNAISGEPLWSRETTAEIETLAVGTVIAPPTGDTPKEISRNAPASSSGPRLSLEPDAGAFRRMSNSTWLLCATTDWQVTLCPLDGVSAPLAPLVGHSGPVRHLLIGGSSKDSGEWFVSAGMDGTVRRWSFDEVTRPDVLAGHADQVFCASVSHDDRWLASVGRDRKLWRWDLRSRRGEPLVDIKPSTSFYVAYAPTDGRLAVAVSRYVWLLDESGQRTLELTGAKRAVRPIAWHPSGQTLAAAGADPVIRFWNTQTGALLSELPGHTAEVRSMAYSPDGRRLASCSDDRTLRIWELPEDLAESSPREPIVATGHTGFVRSVVWDRAGETLFTASSDGTVRQWNATDGKLLRTLGGTSGPLFNVLLSHDERTLFTTGHDKHIRLLDLTTGEQKTTLKGHEQRVTCLTLTHDGQTLITSSQDHRLRLWGTKR